MAHRRLASPFLTTAAAAATLLAGCGTTVVFEGAGGDGGQGATSGQGGSGAQGQGGSGGSGAQGQGGSSPIPCPDEKPSDASSCAGYAEGQICEFTSDWPCPEIPIDAICEAGQWEVNEPLCNPPPPQPCEDYSDPNLCEGNPSCRWIVPGCGESPLDDARCFPAVGCMQDPNACTDAEICAEVSHHPCWDSTCQACHTPVYLCLGDDSDV